MEDFLSSIKAFRAWSEASGRAPRENAVYLAERAAGIDKDINAFVGIDPDSIASSLTPSTPARKLEGVPVGIKSNICIKDTLTTCCSRILENFRPPYDATVIQKLKKEGALLFPGLNMDEFAFGSSCETSFYGTTKNPWNTSCIPGGSSGGAAAGVAAGEITAALGSDTGGSIRQPASLCGVVGFKPTYGRVSRYGLIAFASSLDQIGPITRNMEDCAAIMGVISGYDERDSTSVDLPVPDYTGSLFADIKGMKIGIPEEYFTLGISKDVKRHLDEAVKVFRGMGAEIKEISLPHTKYAVSCYYIIGPAEASSNLARYDGVHYGYRDPSSGNIIDMYTNTRNGGFGAEAKRRILLGTYVLSSGYYEAYYLKAQKVRTKIKEDFTEAFGVCDCILTPTSPTTAFKIGEKVNDPLQMYLSDIFTIPANLAGLPAVSIPCGFGSDGMPIGMQLMGNLFEEETLIRAAHAFERNTGHHEKAVMGKGR
ncbi:MAG: Asp-tRNA(Asn)/Glu-tRNA(Gln) amidotransferase subunit GatA [Candidatus Omnitrophota bacterium]|nr:Asp-tRNA(Asn)/Glu-tRNA(Gln) amidotransferase subunit GatA [Candidatus Omnitrophota bacterium]